MLNAVHTLPSRQGCRESDSRVASLWGAMAERTYTILEVQGIVGIHPRTLRHWIADEIYRYYGGPAPSAQGGLSERATAVG